MTCIATSSFILHFPHWSSFMLFSQMNWLTRNRLYLFIRYASIRLQWVFQYKHVYILAMLHTSSSESNSEQFESWKILRMNESWSDKVCDIYLGTQHPAEWDSWMLKRKNFDHPTSSLPRKKRDEKKTDRPVVIWMELNKRELKVKEAMIKIIFIAIIYSNRNKSFIIFIVDSFFIHIFAHKITLLGGHTRALWVDRVSYCFFCPLSFCP